MPLILMSQAREEFTEPIISKFFDRLYIQTDGSTKGIIEFIIANKKEPGKSISKLNILFPRKIDKKSFKDWSSTFTKVAHHLNRYTKDVKCVDHSQKLYLIDGVKANVKDISEFNVTAIKERVSILSIDFPPIAPSNARAFRIYYEIPHFASVFDSTGHFTYHLNHRRYEPGISSIIDQYIPCAVAIERKSCEVLILLPEGFMFDYSCPVPQGIRSDHISDIIQNQPFATKEGTSLYYDIEASSFDLPGRELGDILEPKSPSGIRLYCSFKKPTVSTEMFDTKTSQLAHDLENRLSRLKSLSDSTISNLEAVAKKLSSLIRQTKTAFIITLVVSALAIILSIITIFK